MSSKNEKQDKVSEESYKSNRLCKIVASGDFDRVKEIVKDAEYYCRKCGRAAQLEENLCKPAKI